MKALAFTVLGVAALALIVWSTAQIAVWQYKNTCEPLMSQDQKSQWLECDKQEVNTTNHF